MPKITRTQGPTVLDEDMTPEARAMRERAERDQEASQGGELARLNSDEAGRGETEAQGRAAKAKAAEEITKHEHELEEIVEANRADLDDSDGEREEEGADSSLGISTSPSSEKPTISPKKSAAKSQSPAPTTGNPSGAGQQGNSSARTTGGASTGKGK